MGVGVEPWENAQEKEDGQQGGERGLGQVWDALVCNVLALGFQPENPIKGLVGSQGVWLEPREAGYA